jgi:hypothetical protein
MLGTWFAKGTAMKMVVALAAMVVATPALAEGGFDTAAFDRFVSARAGDGTPVYWYSEGELRSYPDGKLLAKVEGFDTARTLPGTSDARTQLSRKIYIYRDPVTGEVLREFGGKPVKPIAYPYQQIEYSRAGDNLRTLVTQGAGARLAKIGPGGNATARKLSGDTLAVTAPLYLDMKLPGGGVMQAFENYDFFFAPSGLKLSWLRYGNDALTGQPAVMHMVGWRVEKFADLPAGIRSYVEKEAPLWKAPPVDMAEIARLQKGQ